MTKSAPPGVTGFNWAECQSAFLQGKIGMWLDGVGFAPPLENPEKSRVVGKVGYGVMPKGPKAQAPRHLATASASPKASKKEAAYLFCQWAISQDMGARLLQAGAGVPFRKSVLDDPKCGRRHHAGRMGEGLVGIGEDQPAVPAGHHPGHRVPRCMGVGLTNLIGGADPATELKKATEQFEPVLAKSES